ncbi:MAG: dihydroxyacetone kinase subunit L [Chloroflexi bacterium]|nr:dihydroxyacetone kinase subunit L [Chloroflexota bacterium]
MNSNLTIAEIADSLPREDVGTSLMRCGMAFNEVASSTFGTLLSRAMMQCGKAVRGKATLDPVDVVAMGRAAVESIEQIGKAHRGDKTLLDALIPGVEALAAAYVRDAICQRLWPNAPPPLRRAPRRPPVSNHRPAGPVGSASGPWGT